MTSRPHALLHAAKQAMDRKDYPTAAAAARKFTASIPLPLPVDAFGEDYRTALRILRECAGHEDDLAGRLAAGRMAQAFDPRDTAALLDYGEALRESGQRTEAVAVFLAAFDIRPFSPRITNALAALYTETGDSPKAAAVQNRHLEAVALCLNEHAWLSGNLVYYGAGKSSARDIQLTYPGATELSLVFDHPADGAYLVLKALPHVRYVFEQAALIAPNDETNPVQVQPQQNLRRLDAQTAESAPAPNQTLGAPATINLALGGTQPAGTSLILRIHIEPDPELEPWVRQYGTWHHPRVPVAPAAPPPPSQ